MGLPLFCTGLTLALVSPMFGLNAAFALAGGILMIIGSVCLWIGR